MNWHVPPEWPTKRGGVYLLLVSRFENRPTLEIGSWVEGYGDVPQFSVNSSMSRPWASVLVDSYRILGWIPQDEMPAPDTSAPIP